MSGRILLVDEVSTNRIILKVKLSAAYYDVSQASGLEEAALVLPVVQPDIILINARLIKDDIKACLHLLRPEDGTYGPSVIILTESLDNSLCINALAAGFDDVLTSPTQENYLLSRLRCLMRHRHNAQDLRKHSVAVRALGFAETQQGFTSPATITIVTDDLAAAREVFENVERHLPHRVDMIAADRLMSLNQSKTSATLTSDVLIADLRLKTREDGLRFIADLRASASMKDCPVLPLVSGGTSDLAANLLDMGVSEVLFDTATPQELALRLTTQLDQKRASDEMRDQIKDSLEAAVTDPLTGLYNRRYALSYLKCLLSAAGNEDRTFAVMVADLDHFKAINDSYGHAAGDTVLVRVANTLCNRLKGRDLVARIGGEEFLVILPDTSRFEAHGVAQSLCAAVRNMSLTLPGQPRRINVTISLGVTLASADQVEGQTIDARAHALLEHADRALYKSKAEGRNTVTLTNRTAA